MVAFMQWSSLQKSVSKFTPKRFYEIDPLACSSYNLHIMHKILSRIILIFIDDASPSKLFLNLNSLQPLEWVRVKQRT